MAVIEAPEGLKQDNAPAKKEGPRIAVVTQNWPALADTFFVGELRALEAEGFELLIVSLDGPQGGQPFHSLVEAEVLELNNVWNHPVRLAKACAGALRGGGGEFLRRISGLFIRSDPRPLHLRRILQGVLLAARLPSDVGVVYSYFLSAPGTVAWVASELRKLRWLSAAHARDIWTRPEEELRAKLSELDRLTVCSAYGQARLQELAPDPTRISLHYHGVDLKFFSPAQGTRAEKSENAQVLIASVGRLVPKKGYDVLLEALALLPEDPPWRWEVIGDGGEGRSLRAQARRLGLDSRIEWRGAQDQEAVLELLRRSDLFVLPCREAPDGDRDGLPNVIIEAQSQGLAVVATRLVAIPELIESGRNGLLVPSRDTAALSGALANLISDPETRRVMGEEGARIVRERFDRVKLARTTVGWLKDAVSSGRVGESRCDGGRVRE